MSQAPSYIMNQSALEFSSRDRRSLNLKCKVYEGFQSPHQAFSKPFAFHLRSQALTNQTRLSAH